MKSHITIKDIARELGISISTVSRALSDAWDVKKETRDKVLETAKRLNYHPNLNAKNLQNKHSGIIGTIIPEFVNSFFPNVIMGIQEVLREENYHMLIIPSNESRLQELENMRIMQEYMVDGIIMSVTNEGGNEDEYRRLIESGMPIAFFNRCPEGIEAMKVLIDDSEMACKAVQHLIATGRRNIWHLTGPRNISNTPLRIKGYSKAMAEGGLDYEGKIVTGGIFIADGYNAMKSLLATADSLPDAVFAFNDPLAIGAMKALKEVGVNVPNQVAIVGFSEGSMATVVEPQLTTVLQPMKEMGRCVARLLLKQIRAQHPVSPQTVCLEAKLNVRSSSMSNL